MKNERMKNKEWTMRITEILNQRRRRIRRNIEAMRLRRIRRHTRPSYTYCMN